MVSKEWLRVKTTVEEFETTRGNSVWKVERWLYESVLEEWEQFKRKIAPGDELWSYSGEMGNIGIALVRNGEVIEDFTIMQR